MSSCSRLQSRFFLCKAATLEHEASGRCILWGQCPAVIPVVDHKSGLTAINTDVLAGDETSFVRCQKQHHVGNIQRISLSAMQYIPLWKMSERINKINYGNNIKKEYSSVIHKNCVGALAPTQSNLISFWLYPNY